MTFESRTFTEPSADFQQRVAAALATILDAEVRHGLGVALVHAIAVGARFDSQYRTNAKEWHVTVDFFPVSDADSGPRLRHEFVAQGAGETTIGTLWIGIRSRLEWLSRPGRTG